MSAPVCQFCAAEPMTEKVRLPLGPNKQTVIYQCEQCKRIEAVTE